jgi:hypothetical protein
MTSEFLAKPDNINQVNGLPRQFRRIGFVRQNSVLRPGPAIHAQKRTKTHNLGALKNGYSIDEYVILIL